MAEDSKAGTPGIPAEVGAAGAGTPPVEPKVSADGVADDLAARLAKSEADLAAERELRLKHQGKVEEANRILEQARQRETNPPPTNGPPNANPLAMVTDADVDQLLLLEKSENPVERAVGRAQLAALRAAVYNHEQTQKVSVEAAIARYPAADHKAIRERLDSGKARTVEDAAEHVKLEKLSPLQQENEALKKRVEELSKASGPAPPGTAGRGTGGGGGGGSGDRKTITDSEYARTQSEGTDKEKWAQIMAIRRGELKVGPD